MDFCGIDFFIMDDGFFVVCEVNVNVGFLVFDQVCNLDVGGIIVDYIMFLLLNRQIGKMVVFLGLSSFREKKELDGCVLVQGVVENVYIINSGFIFSESEFELVEIRDFLVSIIGVSFFMLFEFGYNINNRIVLELKFK